MLQKTTITIFFFLLSCASWAQKSSVKCKLTLKSSTEIIEAPLEIRTNLFNNQMIEEASFYKKVRIIDPKSSKPTTYNAKNIARLEFTDLQNEARVYVNDHKQLKRLIYEGALTWYRSMQPHATNGNMQHFNYLVNQEGKEFKLGLFNNRKKQLLMAVAGHKELEELVENTPFDELNLMEVLKTYDLSVNNK